MKLKRLLWVSLFFSFTHFVNGYPREFAAPGDVFMAPDKRHFLKIDSHDRQYLYLVRDCDSRRETSFIDEFNPIFAVKWTSDSKSILIAAHYARGKLLDIIHYDGNKWVLDEIAPPEDREYESEILKWRFGRTNVHLQFKVMIYSRASPEYYICSFDFDPSTGARSNYKKSYISFAQYRDTKSSFAP